MHIRIISCKMFRLLHNPIQRMCAKEVCGHVYKCVNYYFIIIILLLLFYYYQTLQYSAVNDDRT